MYETKDNDYDKDDDIDLTQDEKIQRIRAYDEYARNDLDQLLQIARLEEDDLVRALARAKLEGRALDIIESLIQRLPDYVE